MLPGMELMACPNLAVPREVMHHVVRVESSYNPYAIGVVGGRLVRQPRNLPEALSTVRMLEQRGYNFSLGVAQVNRYNLAKYGLETYEQAFQPCANLQAGSRILAECYRRSGSNWGKSFSCYYSGDFVTGFRHGYVQKVYASMRRERDSTGAGIAPIAVVDRVQRRVSGSAAAPARTVVASASSVMPASLAQRRTGERFLQQNLAPLPAQSLAPPAHSQPIVAGDQQAGALVANSQEQPVQEQAPVRTPVMLAATRIGQPAMQTAADPVEGGDDNAFVF